jgi:anti-sigma B factor antagonist
MLEPIGTKGVVMADPLPGSESTPLLRTETVTVDGVVVVSLIGELDMATASAAAATLREATRAAKAVVVDMTGLRFFASAGLNVLLELRNTLREGAVDVQVAADQRAVLRPLELMGVVDELPMHATLADALAAARRQLH